MENADKITSRQLGALIFVSLLSPLIRVLPRASVALAGSAAWLSPIPAAVFTLFYVLFITWLLGEKGEGLSCLVIRGAGGIAGRVLNVIYGLWLIFYCGFSVRASAERLLSYVYQNGSSVFFIVVGMLVVLVAALGRVRAFARLGQITAPLFILVLALIFLFSAKQVSVENLLPVTFSDADNILLGAIPIGDIASASVYFLFLASEVCDAGSMRKSLIRWLGVSLVTSLLILIVTVGSCAPELVIKYHSAFFVIIRNITVLDVLERIEALIIAVWIISDFALAAALLLSVGEICGTVFKTEKKRAFIVPAAVLAAACAAFVFTDTIILRRWGDYYIPAMSMLFAFVLIPAPLLIGKLRKTI